MNKFDKYIGAFNFDISRQIRDLSKIFVQCVLDSILLHQFKAYSIPQNIRVMLNFVVHHVFTIVSTHSWIIQLSTSEYMCQMLNILNRPITLVSISFKIIAFFSIFYRLNDILVIGNIPKIANIALLPLDTVDSYKDTSFEDCYHSQKEFTQ